MANPHPTELTSARDPASRAIALVAALPVFVLILAALLIWKTESDVRAATRLRTEAAVSAVASRAEIQIATARRRLDAATLKDAPEGVFRFDAFGRLLDQESAPAITSQDPAFFETLARGGSDWAISSFVDEPRFGGRVIAIGRRIEQEGRFAGAVVVFAPADFLADDAASLNLGGDSAIGLARTDGRLVTRHPLPNTPVDLTTHELFTRHLPRAPSGTFDTISPVDRVARSVTYRRLDDLPLIAIVSLSTEVLSDAFWRRARTTGFIALPALLALSGLCAWTILLLRRERTTRTGLERAVAQNQVLFREIHHRIKNNLQTVTALIQLQPGPSEPKEELTSRIAAMSSMHQLLYETDQFEAVDAAQYVERLLAQLRESNGPRITLNARLDSFSLNADQVLPLGLIINEVVSNAYKHAFPNDAHGAIAVDLTAADQDARLVITDNGVGLAETAAAPAGMGKRLVASLVGSLGGAATYESSGGARFTLDFPR